MVNLRVGVVPLIAVVMVLLTVGVPTTLVLAGVWLYASLFNRWVATLNGVASWAAGIIVEASFLLGSSGALAILDPHPHVQFVYVAILLLPLVLGCLLHYFLVRTNASRALVHERTSGEPWLALGTFILVSLVFELIKWHGHDYGIAWDMGSDALGHVMINRAILFSGGISLHQLSTYPSAVNAISAIIDGAGGRANLTGGVLLTRDIQAMVNTIVLSCAACSALFVALVIEATPAISKYLRRVQPIYYVPLFACATLGVGSFIYGLTISGGFLSAIGALPFALASILLGMRALRSPAAHTLVLLSIATVITFASWTALVVVPAAVLTLTTTCYVRHLVKTKKPGTRVSFRSTSMASVAIAIGSLAVMTFEIVGHWASLLVTLRVSGGIVNPVPAFTEWLGAACVLAVITAPSRLQRLTRSVVVCALATGTATALWIKHIGPPGSWSYYSTKMLWLTTVMAIWVPMVLCIDVVRWISSSQFPRYPRRVVATLFALAGSGGFVWYANYVTPWPMTVVWQEYQGRTFPSPQAVSRVIQQANIGGPFILWNYSTNSLSTFLANWWATVTWDATNGGSVFHWKVNSFLNWVYGQNGTVSSLCTGIQEKVGTLRIVTTDTNLSKELAASCPTYRTDLKAGTVHVSVFTRA